MGLPVEIARRVERFFDSMTGRGDGGVQPTQAPDSDGMLIKGLQRDPLLWGGSPYGFSDYGNGDSYMYPGVRLADLYADSEEMDLGDLAAALDIYVDEASQVDPRTQHRLWFAGDDRNIVDELNDLFHWRLNFDDAIGGLMRLYGKYGNVFIEPIASAEDGLLAIPSLPAPTMRRYETLRGSLIGYVQSPMGQFGGLDTTFRTWEMSGDIDRLRRTFTEGARLNIGGVGRGENSFFAVTFSPSEIVHFRLRMRNYQAIYGEPLFAPARNIFRRLMLMEDSMLLYRLTRAPSRYAFYLPTGKNPPDVAQAIVREASARYRKAAIYDKKTGRITLNPQMLGRQDDFFFPLPSDGQAPRVETLNGPIYDDIQSIDYLLRKLYAAIRIPRAHMNWDEATNRATLSQLDVRFARSALAFQANFKTGVADLASVHLVATNRDPAEHRVSVQMAVPSSIYELAQMEVMNARADLMSRLSSHVSTRWLLREVMHLSDEEIEAVFSERAEEKLVEADLARQVDEVMRGGDDGGEEDPAAGSNPALLSFVSEARNDTRETRKDVRLKIERLSRAVEESSEKTSRALAGVSSAVERLQTIAPLIREIAAAKRASW